MEPYARDGAPEGNVRLHRGLPRWLLVLILAMMLALLATVATLAVTYVRRPRPLPDIVRLPVPVNLNYPPHYLFSIPGVEEPIGVAVAPQGDRIYVTETGGERQVKIFDREGRSLGAFEPPRTRPGERSPVYVATDPDGRVYVTDRLQHAVQVYDRDGKYLDTLLDEALTLSEYVAKLGDPLADGDSCGYNVYEDQVYCALGGRDAALPAPAAGGWMPLGIRIDGSGRLLVTDAGGDRSLVRDIRSGAFQPVSWQNYSPQERDFGSFGEGNGQLAFPNVAVSDSRGRVYVSDGNNSRISVWDGEGNFLYHMGRGTGDSSLDLPRGLAIDGRDRLYVVDAVGQSVKVFSVADDQPGFLYSFGDIGTGDGQFYYPNDIAADASGRLYVTDRENNRVQVWAY